MRLSNRIDIGRLLMASASVVALAGPVRAEVRQFNIPAQAAETGVPEFGRQAHVQILAPAAAVRGRRTQAVQGSYTVQDGLGHLIADTGLSVAKDDGHTVILAANAAAPERTANSGSVSLETIVVTARRREESLQKTPVSITAFNHEALETRGARDISNLAQFTPNMSFLTSTGIGGSRTAFVFLRGVGQTEIFLQNDPGVGVYVDGVYLGRTQGSVMEVVDLDRAEVLRGPQGTLYGRNTIGGAINLVSRKPGPTPSFEASLEAGNFNALNIRARASGPLANNLFGSIAVTSLKHDGYVKALPSTVCSTCTNKALSDENSLAGRVSLRWLPTDKITVDLAVDGVRRRDLAVGRRLAYYNPAADVFPPPGYGGFVQAYWGVPLSSFVNPNNNTHQSNLAGYDRQDVWGASGTVQWKLGDATLKSITAYRGLSVEDAGDGDGSPAMFQAVKREGINQHQLSEELQLSGKSFNDRLDWVGGLFAYKEDAVSQIVQYKRFAERGIFSPFPLPFGTLTPCFSTAYPVNSCPVEQPISTNLKVRNLAGYIHLTGHITDQLSITGGLRYSWEEKTFDGSDAFGTPLFKKSSWNSTTPKIGVEYQVDPSVLLYASYSEGFKSGTINNGNDPSLPVQVQPEMLKAYEAGFKSQWFDNRLRVNAAIFSNVYHGQQLQVPTSAFTFAFVNVASSEIKGAEVEFVLKPAAFLTLDGGVGYTHSKITDVAVGTPAITKGAKLVHVPEWTVNLGAANVNQLGDWGKLTTRVDYSYKASQEGDFTNNVHDRVPGYSLVNLRVTAAPNVGGWDVGLYADNLFNKKYEVSRATIAPDMFDVAVDGAPRTFGVRLSVRR